MWYNVNYDAMKAPTMRQNPAFDPPAQSQITLRDFDAPINVGEKYVQRLTSYLQVESAFTRSNVLYFLTKTVIFFNFVSVLSLLPWNFPVNPEE